MSDACDKKVPPSVAMPAPADQPLVMQSSDKEDYTIIEVDLHAKGNAVKGDAAGASLSIGKLDAIRDFLEAMPGGFAAVGKAAAWVGEHTWQLVVVDILSELVTGKSLLGWAEDGVDAVTDAIGAIKDRLFGSGDESGSATLSNALSKAASLGVQLTDSAEQWRRVRDILTHTNRPSHMTQTAFCSMVAVTAGLPQTAVKDIINEMRRIKP